MIRLLSILAVVLVCSGAVQADVLDSPDHVFLENTFSCLRVVDSFALATSEFGLVCLKYDVASEQFDIVSRLELPAEAYTIKIEDSIAAVATWVDVVYFVDISHLPALTLRGEADIGYAFYDYALHHQSLYVANGFDGVWRYELSAYSDPEFADSSMRGIHCIQLDVRGDELLVLDDYNGILRYTIESDSLTHDIGCLYLPRQAGSFCLDDTSLFISLAGRAQLYVATLTDSAEALTDSITLLSVPQGLETIDSFVVAMNLPTVSFEIINTRTLTATRLLIPGDYPDYYDGDAHAYGGRNYLYIPTDTGGLYSFDLNRFPNLTTPEQAYAHPGPVTGLLFHADRLVTAGRDNPLEFWTLPLAAYPTLDTTAYGMTHVRAITGSDWACFALLPDANEIVAMTVNNDSLQILESFGVSGSATRSIKYVDDGPVDTLDALLVFRSSQIDIWAVAPDHSVRAAATVAPSIDILDAVMVDSFLVVSTGKSQVFAYKLNGKYSATLWWAISSPKPIRHLIPTSCVDTSASGLSAVVCGFANGAMYKIKVPRLAVGSVSYVQSLPMEVRKSVTVGSRLYSVGDGGIGVFDLSSGFPEFLEHGGYGGRMIASDGAILATSSGTGVLLYDLGVVTDSPDDEPPVAPKAITLANYPNPFNPSTSIRYVLPAGAPTRLTVVNLLGQTVSVLVDRFQEAGTYEIPWNGTDDQGERVASGVYFCHLTSSGVRESRKMILLK